MPANSFMSWVTRPRIYAYGIISTLAALYTVALAFDERSNFYAAVVFLGRSNGCLLVLLNFLLVIALVAGRILQLLYFGQLRRSEVELVCERSWYSLVGTLLAVSIFRDDFSVSFVILFGVLLFLKIFHWLSAERVASIMQSPSVPRIFHARMVSILTTLLIADLLLVGFSLQMLLVKKVKIGMMVLFTSEFIILTALLGNTIAQYALNCIDMAREEPWEAKSLYVLYVDLAHDIVRLCTHGYFFILLTRLYGIPLSLIHDLYSAGRSCTVKVKALVRYRQAVRKMETKYPNATATDLASTDGTCIICREDMVALSPEDAAAPAEVTNVTPKKLSCGHIFHFRCLRSWLERQQSCPTCRRMILDDEPEVPAPVAPATPQQQPAAPLTDAATPAEGTGTNPQTTAAEEAYDHRLQGFLSRLQSDLRKVREEGNVSARQAASSRRRTGSRSGRSTPRLAGTSGSNGGTGLFGSSRYGRINGNGAGLSSGFLPSQAGGEEVGAGGLWMPPPPSTLYPGGRRSAPVNGIASQSSPQPTPGDADADSKGKGKAREDDPSDPLDPKEAIRQATLRRFGIPSATTSSPSAPTDTPNSEAIGMIPLFDPTTIPDFSAHQASLPHALLARPAPSGERASADLSAVLDAQTRAVHHQIALLTGIQARIDTVIADLTNVLDGVDAAGYARSTQDATAGMGDTNSTSH
ncbi:Zinc finger, RING-H2-type [Kalmanozyma brasiliensis GHG001]|uniref:RING-type E3 ubiquitin transferase n=1 Tax=Kalmanozyma brasiliensis (strain GHG001) TaxID=1365824 RepID=V5ETS2_KALBG|nr:Zinc finger, RING-H2-type [Kalmanozyma brasiliensis GHG001]EST06478.1 Zinc finger, RING-H2-type [Kalmanozyma brasiliensis GHG001]